MPEANAHRPILSADIPGCARPLGKEGRLHGPELTPNNGWGRVKAAYAAGTAEAFAGSLSGTSSGRSAVIKAEGGPAGLIVDVVVREDRRGKGLGFGQPGKQSGKA